MIAAPSLSTRASAQPAANLGIPLPNQPILQEQKVVPGDVTPDSAFGDAVALNGSTALFGAFSQNNYQGAAYLYNKADGVWTEGQKLTASDAAAEDRFGFSVALADDTLFVGALSAVVNGVTGQGAVYVFQKQVGSWVQTQKLTASDGGGSGSFFGSSVGLSGRTLVVGARGSTVNGIQYEGAAYVFVETNGTWSEVQKLTSNDGAGLDLFGSAVAIEGPVILVGAPNKVVSQNPATSGKVYVYTRSNGVWPQTQGLFENGNGADSQYGFSLALNRSSALVGSYKATVGGVTSGAVYAFAVANRVLTPTQTIAPSDGRTLNCFGTSVALSGNTALIGASGSAIEGKPAQGKGYLFRFGSGVWSQAGELVASDGMAYDELGYAVALDRETAAITRIFDGGAAYFYGLPGGARP